MKKFLFLMLLAILLAGCNTREQPSTDYFTERDFDDDYKAGACVNIYLNGDSAVCSSGAVLISGSTVTITDEGTYVLSGCLDDGMVIVNSDKTDKTQLVLDGASIHSVNCAPIYILQSDKVFITLAPDSVNELSNGGTFTANDESNIDGVIFSREDITLNGSGALSITSPAGHGIVSKDSLTVTGGYYEIDAASHGLAGKDDVAVVNASLTITSGKDGIHVENSDDAAKGYVYIQSGTFDICAEGDGLSASSTLQIEDGIFNITSGGGSINAEKLNSDGRGDFMGGGRHPGGGYGGPMDQMESDKTEEDGTSMKGIKSGGELVIQGGTFIIDSADDAVHSNTNIAIHGGAYEITTGDDAFHADEILTVTSGEIRIAESYEGLEGLHIEVLGGEITLDSSDDGMNAAGGTDQSGFGGHRGDDRFGGGPPGGVGNSDGSITVSGGTIHITASGDGIDANGTLMISGGHTVVCGPTTGDTATLDYDVSAAITGGTFIGTGASNMAQTFSDSAQGVFAVSVGNQDAGTQIVLADADGKTVISHIPDLPFGVVILSSPEIQKGETYTITVGAASGTFKAS